MAETVVPTTLYKFRSWGTPHHQTLLTENRLWVPVAAKLNDPFDCCIPYRYDLMDESELVRRFVKSLRMNEPNIPEIEATVRARARIEELGILDTTRKWDVLSGFAFEYRKNHGVLSLASIFDSPLMWAHYADCHRGFCVGIEVTKLLPILKDFFYGTGIAYHESWIQYMDEVPIIVPLSDEAEDLNQHWRLLTTKSSLWSYEKEYRYVFTKRGEFPLMLDSSSISEIILGCEMLPTHRAQILNIAREKFPHAKVRQARKKAASFELEYVSM